jgi:2'-5' RNA ligase
MRLFIALELPSEVKQALNAAQQRLERSGQHPVKWVSPASMHLTLHFLGETEPAQVPALLAALEEACAIGQAAGRPAAPLLRLAALGAFPNLRRPSTIWAGVEGALQPLQQLHQALGHALEPLGFVTETRPFRAHLTLGRVRRDATPQQCRALGAALSEAPAPEPVRWPLGEPALFESTLTREGARYTRIDYA